MEAQTNQEKQQNKIPPKEKYGLTLSEAISYFSIGRDKLVDLLKSNNEFNLYFLNGNKIIVKRQAFENFLENISIV